MPDDYLSRYREPGYLSEYRGKSRDIPSDDYRRMTKRSVDPQWREIQRTARDYEALRAERGESVRRDRRFRQGLMEGTRDWREGRVTREHHRAAERGSMERRGRR